MTRLFPVLCHAALACAPIVVAAQSEQPEPDSSAPSLTAMRLLENESIALDGLLTEPVWGRAQSTVRFVQQEPNEGAEASQRSLVRVVFDSEALYIGARLEDTEPGRILGYQKERDAGLGSDDRFMWILDTFADGRSAYFFETNPAGLMGDGLLRLGSGRGLNKSWDGIWEARVTVSDFGWSVEARIPFRTLNFDPESSFWGINFQRTIRRDNEELLWSGHRLNQGLFRPIHAGRLLGLSGTSQGVGLELTPYVVGALRRSETMEDDNVGDVGIDLNYSLTPSLRAALTVNTDFAEVEVDQRRVNLTRFPLFFPERRDFFLEGSSVYRFAGANGANPFFSRRIGLDDDGTPVPIQFGLRLGGQAGDYDLGLMQVRTGSNDTAPTEDFTVARLRRNFWAQSSLGAIYTRRSGSNESDLVDDELVDRHTVGMDLDLFTSTFMGDKNLQFEAFMVTHNAALQNDSDDLWDRSVRGVRINFPNETIRAHSSYREYGKGYDPAVGFVARNGFRRLQPSFTFAPRPDGWSPIRQFEFGVFFEFLFSLDNRLLTRNLRFEFFQLSFDSGDGIALSYNTRFEKLDDSFEIVDEVIIPIGDYDFNEFEVNFESADQRRISAELGYASGSFWTGDRRQWEAELTLRPMAGLEISADIERNEITLPTVSFDTQLVRQRTEWHLSPWASVTSIVQYDDVSRLTGWFARLRWILKPGSDLFFVYTQNWTREDGLFRTLEKAASAKMNYTHRF